VQYEGVHCTLAIEQISSGVILLKIAGSDIGEFGHTPIATVDALLSNGGAVDFFIDARDVRGASIDVSGEWAKWLRKNRERLRRVTMLTGSRFVQITAEFVRHFAGLEGIMRISTDSDAFDNALREAQLWR
jgi:hypothetical protein